MKQAGWLNNCIGNVGNDFGVLLVAREKGITILAAGGVLAKLGTIQTYI